MTQTSPEWFAISEEATPTIMRRIPDWPPRRLNSALNYVDDAKLVHPLKAIGSGPWVMTCLRVTDHTRRFVRDHG